MPEYTYAVCSALLWAVSAPILNYGLRHIPKNNPKQSLAICLLIANLSGIIVLLPFIEFEQFNSHRLLFLIIAGIFIYPLATGLYYASGIAFGNRMELASLFAKVKPVISIVFAYFIFSEHIFSENILPITLVISGVLLLILHKQEDKSQTKGVILGLGTAIFWALGEVFIMLGIGEHSPEYSNFIALCSGFIIFASFLWINKSNERNITYSLKWIVPFALHGMLSFGFAYALFFHSLKQIGLSQTVVINAFWPFLAIIITGIIRLLNRQKLDIGVYTFLAIVLIISGSLIQTMMIS